MQWQDGRRQYLCSRLEGSLSNRLRYSNRPIKQAKAGHTHTRTNIHTDDFLATLLQP
jgi:hypothetical protein